MENLQLVDWSRAQFALTAMYHWIFVPLTLGLAFIIAIFESIYVKTGNEEWKKITKFWTTLFGVNFAIGVSTGIILEFEFGTNWSKYSWFVGDIFGAPLAVEGIMAFFLESTFIAVMFFGWNKVSKRFHLLSTWLVAIGANLSALWILVANAWMQYPVGVKFNPASARNEMVSFWEVLFSPVAVHKFLHTVSSGYVTAAIFVIGVSAWFLLKNTHIKFARRSILVAGVFGLVASLFVAFTGDGSAKDIAKVQPMKLAAIEGLYTGKTHAPLTIAGIIANPKEEITDENRFAFKVDLPDALSIMVGNNSDIFVPGINDLIKGNPEYGILSAKEKIERGQIARNALKELNNTKIAGDTTAYKLLLEKFTSPEFQKNNFSYFGYGFINDTKELVPNVAISFYSFRIMVALGFLFILLFIMAIYLSMKDILQKHKYYLIFSIFAIPLVYIAGQAGWVVAEVGRQPWIIQDLLPTSAAVTNLKVGTVQTTFVLFAIIFTTLLIAEIGILLKQIKIGPKE